MDRVMSTQERITRCKVDIEILQKELKRLEASPKPRHGDIVVSRLGHRRIVIIGEGNYPKAYSESGCITSGYSNSNPKAVNNDYAVGFYTVIGNIFNTPVLKDQP